MDLIIHNAKVYTLSDVPQLKFAEAVAVAAGKSRLLEQMNKFWH